MSVKDIKFDKEIIAEEVRIGAPVAFQDLLVGFSFLLIQAIILGFDSSILIPTTTTPLIYPYFFVNIDTQKVSGVLMWIAALGAVFVGVGVGLCVLAGGAPSGDDALAMSLSSLTKKDIRIFYLISDLSVLLLSLTYISLERIFYSLVTVLLSGQIIGWMQRIEKMKFRKQ